jgi:tetratricopeptide (TPR) repeat protein
VLLALHAVNGLAVLLLARRLGASRPAAWIGGLLFLLHPLQADAVSRLSEARSVAATSALLLALHLWILHRRRPSWVGWGGAWTAGLLATVLHPALALFPVAFLLFDRLLGPREVIDRRRNLRDLAPVVAVPAAVFVGIDAGRWTSPVPLAPSGSLLLEPGLWGRAARNLLLPWDLSPVYATGTDSGALVVAAIFAVAAGFAGVALVRLRRRFPEEVFAVALFLLLLGPRAAGVFPGDEAILGDRYFYAALIPVGLGLASILDRWAGLSVPRAVLARGAASVLLAIAAVQSHHRATVLGDEVTCWREAVAAEPGSVPARIGLGEALLAHAADPRGRSPGFDPEAARLEAIDALRSAAILVDRRAGPLPSRIRVRRGLSEAFEALGRTDEAIAAVDERIRFLERVAPPGAPPDAFAEAYRDRGRILRKGGRDEEALRDLRAATRWDPSDAPAWLEMGRLFVEEGRGILDRGGGSDGRARVEEGIAALRRALEVDPGSLDARLALGEAHRAIRDYIRAVRAFEDAAAEHPDSARPRFHLARLYLAVSDLEEASRQIEMALRLDPLDVDSLLLMAAILRVQGREELADRTVESAYVADPASPEVRERWREILVRQGRESMQRGELDSARDRVEAAVRLGARGGDTYLLLGEIDAAAGRPDRAAESFERALESEGSDRDAVRVVAFHYKDLGYVRLVEGRRPEAMAAFRRAIELLPEEPEFAVIRRILETE